MVRTAFKASALACLTLVGCTGQITGTPIPFHDKTWSLMANANLALVDEQNLEFGAYPNPRGVTRLTVSVEDDGRLCADDGKESWCGGPLQGIPYLAILNQKEDSYCIRVVDIFGHQVRQGCAYGAPSQAITEGSSGSIVPDDVSSGSPQDDVEVGARLVVDAINAGLARIGLSSRVSLPQGAGLVDFEQGDITVGRGTCADVAEYLESEFSDDHPGTDDYVFGSDAVAECLEQGRCRIGQLVTRAMAEACASMPAGLQQSMVQTGIVGGGGHAVAELCTGEGGEIESCVGSPLVLDLAGDGLQLKGLAGGVTFPLLGSAALSVGWLAGSDDALLALDIDGDGRISSGRELFGESTGGWAPNGFAALARYDENHDGKISAADSVFERLLAWRDDGDGRSQPSELIPLREVGIRSIGLGFEQRRGAEAAGNQLGLFGSARDERGKQLPIIDVWFLMKGATQQAQASPARMSNGLPNLVIPLRASNLQLRPRQSR